MPTPYLYRVRREKSKRDRGLPHATVPSPPSDRGVAFRRQSGEGVPSPPGDSQGARHSRVAPGRAASRLFDPYEIHSGWLRQRPGFLLPRNPQFGELRSRQRHGPAFAHVRASIDQLRHQYRRTPFGQPTHVAKEGERATDPSLPLLGLAGCLGRRDRALIVGLDVGVACEGGRILPPRPPPPSVCAYRHRA